MQRVMIQVLLPLRFILSEIIEVADIATLRNQSTGSNIYRLTGGDSYFSAKYILSSQMGSRCNSPIYIYDTAGKITTAYNIGDE